MIPEGLQAPLGSYTGSKKYCVMLSQFLSALGTLHVTSLFQGWGFSCQPAEKAGVPPPGVGTPLDSNEKGY